MLSSLRWPLPALITWTLCWLLYLGLHQRLGLPDAGSLVVAAGLGLYLARQGDTEMRRMLMTLGFPLSAMAASTQLHPVWWLLPLALLLMLYPLRAWKDAPLFPTQPGVLEPLPEHCSMRPAPLVLDAGCGLGDGLIELHRVWPDARLQGHEWSWPIRWLCGLRLLAAGIPARLSRCDMWQQDWSDYDMVYLFQRPETMPHAAQKAQAELQPGAWLLSLEFPVEGWTPHAQWELEGRKAYLYQPHPCAEPQEDRRPG